MSKKLFVGGLSWNTTEDALRDAFAPYGELVEVKVITDRDTGRSRGFGFVTFEDADAADSAIASLNDTMLDGRTIRVNESEERRPRSGGGGGGRGRPDGRGGRGGGGGGGRRDRQW